MGGAFRKAISSGVSKKLIKAVNAEKAAAAAEQSTANAKKTVEPDAVTSIRPAKVVDAKSTRRNGAKKKEKKKSSLLKTKGLLADSN